MVSPVLAEAILNQKPADILGRFQRSFDVAKETGRQERARTLAGEALRTGGGEALEELSGIAPELYTTIQEQIRAKDAQGVNDFIRDARVGLNYLQTGNEQGFLNFYQGRVNALKLQGRDSSDSQEIIDLVASGQGEQARQLLAAFTSSVDQSKGVVVGGRIVDPVTGRVIFEDEGDVVTPAQVQSSEILPDGTTVQVLKDGGTRVTSPAGEELTGSDRALAISQARKFGVEVSGEGAGARAAKAQIAKDRQELRKTVFGAARQGQKTLKEVSSLRKALQSIKTGRLAAARQQAGGLIPGIRDADAEALNSAINEFVLRRKDELLGGGVLSDADIALLQGVGPQLGNTVEANLNILERFERVAKNDLERGKRLRKFKGDPLEFDIEEFLPEEPSAPAVSAQTQEIKFLGFE